MLTLFVLCVITFSIVWRLCKQHPGKPCPVWLSFLIEKENPFFKIRKAATILEHAEIREGMNVLDAGCGPGRLTIPIAKKIGPQGEVVAMDIQQKMLDKVRKKTEKYQIKNVRFLQAGLGDGRLEENAFDRALLITVLGEVPDQQAALKELFLSLKPDGILAITELITDPDFVKRDRVIEQAHRAGFQTKAHFGGRYAFTLLFEKQKTSDYL